MDPISSLISKLNEQFQQKAAPDQLLATIRSIESMLLNEMHQPVKSLGTTKVAVIMPSTPSGYETMEMDAFKKSHLPTPETSPITSNPSMKQVPNKEELKPPVSGQLFDPVMDVPTLAQQKTDKEINETISPAPYSLNDKLKNEVLEVGHILTETPIRDLRKAIGINERFVFISELFRGDDSMYERSIKTINGFRILAEAQYWMERELKVKLGWNEENPVVSHFYQLVKRRFSGL